MMHDPIAVPDPRSPVMRHAQDSGFKTIFRLSPKAKWPAEGLMGADVQQVCTSDGYFARLWVEPLMPTSRPGVPRLFAQCPRCLRTFAGGRIQQHYVACAHSRD